MITHVAIIFDGRVWSLPKPYRHNHIFGMIHNLSKEFGMWTGDQFDYISVDHNDQGFLTDTGTFLTRKKALDYARSLSQLNESEIQGDELYSENLW